MTVDHRAAAFEAFTLADLPAPPRTVDDAFRYVRTLVGLLPPADRVGFVKAPPGGENVVIWQGQPVRAGRVCYPDGTLYKVMNDVPNGGPQWVHEEDGRADLYLAAMPGDDGGTLPPPVHDANLVARVQALEATVATLKAAPAGGPWATSARVEAINENLRALDLATVKTPLPDYEGRVFGFTITLHPKVR